MQKQTRLVLSGCVAVLTAVLVACGGGGASGGGISETGSASALSVSVSTLTSGVSVQILVTNTSTTTTVAAPSVALASWLSAIALNPHLQASETLPPGASVTLTFALGTDSATEQALTDNYQYILSNPSSSTLVVSSTSLSNTVKPELEVNATASLVYRNLMQDTLINADMWSDTAEIMSANYAFEGIEGVGTLSDTSVSESAATAAGGTWQTIVTTNASATAYTTAATPNSVYRSFGYPTFLADALPVCFSWPVLPSTVNRKSFAITLNTGAIVKPYVTSIGPNLEYNERACVVLFGEFGNRLTPAMAGAIYPTLVSIVAGEKTLMLVGPSGPISAVGLSKASTHPYLANAGPTMNAAKLSAMSALGESAPPAFSTLTNNDCVSLYGPTVQYRLRTFSTGGTAPDGVAAILPTDFANYFRIQVTRPGGQVFWITQSGTGTALVIPEGTIEVAGLADLGEQGTPLNDAYVTDRDNQIDICLKGNLAAMQLITGLDIPAAGSYKRFYNPGGPGNNPVSGVTYGQPGAAQFLTVTNALSTPKTVNYP